MAFSLSKSILANTGASSSKPIRIRERLLVLVLAILIPAFLAAAVGIGYVYNEQQASFRRNVRETTRALALVLDKEIAKREGVLRTLAASPDLDQKDFASFYTHAAQIASYWKTTIYLTDPHGRQKLVTRLPFGTEDASSSAPLLALDNKNAEDATVISNLHTNSMDGGYDFAVQIPVKRDGRLAYYLGMDTSVGQLQSVFQEQQLPADWVGTILDRDGKVVARSSQFEKYVGRQVSMGFARQFDAHPEGFYEAVSLSGVPVFAFYSRAPNSGWVFVVNVPKSTMFSAMVNALALLTGILLVLLGLAVVAALGIARHTAKPIESLRRAAERLGRGERVEAEHSGFAETMEVSVAMARASDEICTVKAELERRVEAAVAAAERSQQALLQGQKLEALGRLTGGIAHDFNNVLQTLTTGLQVAYLTSNDPKTKSSLDVCHRAVRRATELISQMMAFGRVQDARLETVEVPQQIANAMPLLKGGLRSDVMLHTDIPEQLWRVTLDPLQFELALLNLTINARDAMPHGGSLRLEARNESLSMPNGELAPGDYVRLSIVDSGEGMNAEVLAKALDPFFTTKSVGKGTGMGLSQAYGFAKQTGGTLILESEEGKGTCAILYLPRASQMIQQIPDKQHLSPRAACSGMVLFVEDDPLVRDAVAPALRAAGFQVLIADNGEEAIAVLERNQSIDLVFSDIVMPGHISGTDLAQFIQDSMPHIRIVLATGYSDHRVSFPDVRVLSKPYDVADIVEAFNDALRLPDDEPALSMSM